MIFEKMLNNKLSEKSIIVVKITPGQNIDFNDLLHLDFSVPGVDSKRFLMLDDKSYIGVCKVSEMDTGETSGDNDLYLLYESTLNVWFEVIFNERNVDFDLLQIEKSDFGENKTITEVLKMIESENIEYHYF